MDINKELFNGYHNCGEEIQERKGLLGANETKTPKCTNSKISYHFHNRPFYFLKRGFDLASKSGKFLKENKTITPFSV